MPTTSRIVFQSSYLIILGYELGSNFTVRATAYQLTMVVVIVTLTVSRMFGNCTCAPPLIQL